MRKKMTIFIGLALAMVMLVPTVSAVNYWDFLTKARADTLYCALTGCTMEGDIDMGGHDIINAIYVNATYTNLTINSTQVTNPIWVNKTGDTMTGGLNISIGNLSVSENANIHKNFTMTDGTGEYSRDFSSATQSDITTKVHNAPIVVSSDTYTSGHYYGGWTWRNTGASSPYLPKGGMFMDMNNNQGASMNLGISTQYTQGLNQVWSWNVNDYYLPTGGSIFGAKRGNAFNTELNLYGTCCGQATLETEYSTAFFTYKHSGNDNFIVTGSTGDFYLYRGDLNVSEGDLRVNGTSRLNDTEVAGNFEVKHGTQPNVSIVRSNNGIVRFDELGRVSFGGEGTDQKYSSAYIQAEADEEWQLNEYGSALNFYTTSNNGATPAKAFKITSNQDFSIPNDNKRIYLGGGDDSFITFDGTNLVLDGDSWNTGTQATQVPNAFNVTNQTTISHSPKSNSQVDASLFINPNVATGNAKLIAGSVGGAEKFWIDEDGDMRLVKSLRIQEIGGSNYLDFTLGGFNFVSSNPLITLSDTTADANDWLMKNKNGDFMWQNDLATITYMNLTRTGDLILPNGSLNINKNLTVGAYERHIQVPVLAVGTVANLPTPIDVGTAGGYQFASAGSQEELHFQWEVPYDWEGTNITVEIDWLPDSGAMTNPDAMKWVFEYRAIAEGESIMNGDFASTNVTYDSNTAQYLTVHSPVVLPIGSGNQPINTYDHLYFKVWRDTGVANDFAGTSVATAFEIIYNSTSNPRI